MLDRYLAATPAMSLVPLAPFDFILVLFSFVYAAAVTHDENGHSGNIQRSTSNIELRAAGLRFSLTTVGCKVRAGLADWRSRFKLGVGIWYFAALQTALTG